LGRQPYLTFNVVRREYVLQMFGGSLLAGVAWADNGAGTGVLHTPAHTTPAGPATRAPAPHAPHPHLPHPPHTPRTTPHCASLFLFTPTPPTARLLYLHERRRTLAAVGDWAVLARSHRTSRVRRAQADGVVASAVFYSCLPPRVLAWTSMRRLAVDNGGGRTIRRRSCPASV